MKAIYIGNEDGVHLGGIVLHHGRVYDIRYDGTKNGGYSPYNGYIWLKIEDDNYHVGYCPYGNIDALNAITQNWLPLDYKKLINKL